MSIKFFLENIEKDPLKKFKKSVIKEWIIETIKEYNKKPGEISVIFTDNQTILDLNKRFLNHNYFTDVITFPYSEGGKLSGDIFISIDQVAINAIDFKTIFEEELFRVIIHGILHLIGFDDENDNNRMHMHVLENDALEKLSKKLNILD